MTLIALATLMAGCQASDLQPVTTAAGPERMHMREFGGALPPLGYVSFCRRSPEECPGVGSSTRPVRMSTEKWTTLNAINAYANHVVSPVTDQELYGTLEHWMLPDRQGDCEDYVLLKRKLLIGEGWPVSSLLITVVRDEKQEGHAVLTVATDMGDLILDNKTDLIRPFTDTSYTYYKRQSRADARAWVALMPGAESDRSLAATRAQRP
jgi:predicted transglutaminase-like cysteine proteinase